MRLTEILIIAAFVLMLTYVPVAGKYVSLFNTMIHESGHALMARLLGGRVLSVHLYSNTEGMAETTHNSWLARVLTRFIGYPFASMISVAAIYGMVNGYMMFVAMGLTIFLAYNLLFWVRNIVGWLWTLSALTLLYGLYIGGYDQYFQWTLNAIVIAVWIQALVSAWEILILSIRNRKDAGDASILARLTLIPAVVWRLVFAVQATILFIQGFYFITGGDWIWGSGI